jgi:CRP-like cAMP-binding protein
MDLKKIEQEIKAHIDAGNTEKAVRIVYEAVVHFAKEKQFTTAEALRDKIYDIDPLALTEIVEAAEIIELEKNESIDKNHQGIFKDLYSDLTPEEGNAIFFAMEEVTFSSGDNFFSQGHKNNELFFVDKGSLKLLHQKGKENIFIEDVKPGNIAGTESFFKTSVCTTSLVGDLEGSLHVLKKNKLDRLAEEYPGLSPKLQDFAYRLKSTSDLLKEKGLNRRVYKRFKTNGAIVFQILSGSGKAIGKVLKGKLSDVSAGGLSFYFTTSNERNVNLLLGRDLMMKFIIPESRNRTELKKKGQVLSVLPQMNHEYSIHLKFDSILDPKYML